MPHVKVKTSSGSVNFHYTISTPTHTSTKSINKNLPTVIFIHPVYIAQDIYHPQFSDPQLRRFNLIAIDSRSHGETTGKVSKNFGRVEAAEDIYKFMEALKLPACHFFGMSMGACISLQVAITYPQKVLSLYMVSPLPLEEPQEVREGRQEIFDCWAEAFKNPKRFDESALLDAVYGALQLGFNSVESSLISAMRARTIPQAMRNWPPSKIDEMHTVSVKFFADRKPHPRSSLEKVVCPLTLIHCAGDIAYPIQYAQEFLDALHDAGVNARMHVIDDACHFGSVTHPKEINPIFHDFVIQNTKGLIPPAPAQITSPFEANLIKAGWAQDECDSDYEI
ncbi:Alpha/Beta hydrolase protein [Infundibulicybe gibba]|nr:Alpha/Beta hydrolase protein [Infundibulicybe gibba]